MITRIKAQAILAAGEARAVERGTPGSPRRGLWSRDLPAVSGTLRAIFGAPRAGAAGMRPCRFILPAVRAMLWLRERGFGVRRANAAATARPGIG